MDYRRDSKRTGMVCFGVGATECVPLARAALGDGGHVRMLVANRDAVVLGPELKALEAQYPRTLRVSHYLSRPRPGAADVSFTKGHVQGHAHWGPLSLQWCVFDQVPEIWTPLRRDDHLYPSMYLRENTEWKRDSRYEAPKLSIVHPRAAQAASASRRSRPSSEGPGTTATRSSIFSSSAPTTWSTLS